MPNSNRSPRGLPDAIRTASPLILYAVVVAGLHLMGLQWESDVPMLLPLLNAAIFFSAIVASVLAARAFMHGGSPALLTLGAGSLVFGLAAMSSALLVSFVSVDTAVTTHNTAALIAGLLLLSSVIGGDVARVGSQSRRRALFRMYLALVAVVAVVALVSYLGVIPAYMTPDGQPTNLRTLVLGSAILAYASAAVASAMLARVTGRRFLRWFSVGLGFVTLGLIAVGLGRVGSAVGWVGRASQLAGQLYIVASLFAALRERRPGTLAMSGALADSFQEVLEMVGRNRAQLNVAIEAMTDAVSITDADGDFIVFNDAFTSFYRLPSRDVAPEDVWTWPSLIEVTTLDGDPVPMEMWPTPRALKGESASNQEFVLTSLIADERWIGSFSYAPILDERGRVVGSVAVGRDITETKRAEETERARASANEAIARIERTIHGTLDRDKMLTRVAQESAAAIGAESTVLAVRDGDLWVVEYAYNMPEELIGKGFSAAQAPFMQMAADSGEPLAIDDAFNDPRAVRETQQGLGVRAVMLAPLVVRGEAIGGLFFNYPQVHSFTEEDLFYASRLATSVGLALANIELYEAEHGIAETLQETLVVLPSHIAGLRYARSYKSATYQPGHVGGDFVDVFEVSGNLVGLSLGDVSGKGVGAAVTTSLVRTTLRVHALDGLAPGTVVEKTNEVVHRSTDPDSFVTLWFGLVDTKSGAVRYVGAGHPPVLAVDREGNVRELAGSNAFIGAFPGMAFDEGEATLKPGERLLLYSDGVTEARSPDGELFGERRLWEFAATLADMPTENAADELMRTIRKFSDGVLKDDAAILVVELEG